eukprot:1158226-Pelagomonas_calceolata.AAC.2
MAAGLNRVLACTQQTHTHTCAPCTRSQALVTLTGCLPPHSRILCSSPHSPYNPQLRGCSWRCWTLACQAAAAAPLSAAPAGPAAAAAAAAAAALSAYHADPAASAAAPAGDVVAAAAAAAAAAAPVPAVAAAAHAGHAGAVGCILYMLTDPACQDHKGNQGQTKHFDERPLCVGTECWNGAALIVYALRRKQASQGTYHNCSILSQYPNDYVLQQIGVSQHIR